VNDGSPKPRDLEERTFLFAQSIRAFVKTLPRTVGNAEDGRQLVRASGSVAANWIEADEALSKKDFLMRAKICRKEAKESRLFLRLIEVDSKSIARRNALAAEARELTLIFSAIISKSSRS
jgi:four helix bundle protein